MSLQIEGRKCVVCQAYLFSDDDVVFCPECGAPHHRDCYKSVGHCGLSHLHGTPDEYKFVPMPEPTEEPEKIKNACRNCGKEIPEGSRFCPYCRAQQVPPVVFEIKTPEMPEQVGDIPTADIQNAVGPNVFRYVNKFKDFTNGRRVSWNWAAFLVPHGWFAFRKMYGYAAIAAAVMIAASIFTVPLMLAMENMPILEAAESTAVVPDITRLMAMAEYIMQAGPVPIICGLISSLLNIALRVISALFGDYLYKGRIEEVCREANDAEDREEHFKRRGGVSFLGFIIAFYAVTIITTLLSELLM